mmetsp:Transcript_7546/g.11192  ORF Transcript_7546/g.11192 Transcript_7546/m.11192 type:complete len:206 (-) Transcript_7546:854-1471(-)
MNFFKLSSLGSSRRESSESEFESEYASSSNCASTPLLCLFFTLLLLLLWLRCDFAFDTPTFLSLSLSFFLPIDIGRRDIELGLPYNFFLSSALRLFRLTICAKESSDSEPESMSDLELFLSFSTTISISESDPDNCISSPLLHFLLPPYTISMGANPSFFAFFSIIFRFFSMILPILFASVSISINSSNRFGSFHFCSAKSRINR